MRLVYASGGQVYDLDADLQRPDAQVVDLAAALGAGVAGSAAPGLYIDGLYQPGEYELIEAGIHEAATISFSPPTSLEELPAGFEPGLYVTVLSGADAGHMIPIATDADYIVGRGDRGHIRISDRTVSREHCRLSVNAIGTMTVTNLSSTAGTRVDGVAVGPVPLEARAGAPVLIGSVVLTVRWLGVEDRMTGFDRALRTSAGGTVGLNRPPRVDSSHTIPELSPPESPTDAGKAPFNLAAMLLPAVMGGAIVIITKQVEFALFALLSPLMALGNWWETSHQSKKKLRSSTREFFRQLETFQVAVADRHTLETSTRRDEIPDPPEIVRRALLPSVHLWERRPAHADFLQLNLGQGDEAWHPELVRTAKAPGAEVTEVLTQHKLLYDVPQSVELGDGGVVGIVGPRSLALAAARSLLCQAAVLHGPADLRIGVVVADDPERQWDWAKWLPHTRDVAAGRERTLLATGPDESAELLERLVAEGKPKKQGLLSLSLSDSKSQEAPAATTLLVVDGDELLAGRNSPARRLLGGTIGPAAGIVVASSADRLPAVCTEIVTIGATGEATVVRPRLGRGEQPVRLALLDVALARRVALALGRLDDPELHVAGAGLPSVVRLGGLLGVGAWNDAVVAERWRRAASDRDRLMAAIGVADDGLFELDFDRHGPHGLIGGTTGSGKSELLKTLVASLAASYPPEQLTFGLFDFKGGATFTDFATLPHTVGMASDLDVNLAKRALRCLRAELVHRERVFETAGVKDLAELNDRQALGDSQAVSVEAIPRLVVIIDEFAAMAKELAEEIGALADLTARGRSLGVHLLLATQKPSTAVNAEIKTNTRLRISLQVEDRQDSTDVVGIGDAADINHKGRGYFRVGQGEVLPIQTAWSTGKVVTAEPSAVALAPFVFGPRAAVAETDGGGGMGGTTTELHTLVEAVGKAHTAGGRPPPRKPWPDPLPDVLTLTDLAGRPADPGRPSDGVLFALADDPDRQMTYPVGWSPRSGNVLFYGVVGAGTTTALATLALSFVGGTRAEDRHLYVIDSGGGDLLDLEGLPHCGAAIRATEIERQRRMIRHLTRVVEQRRSMSPQQRAASAETLLVIDNLEAFRSNFDEGTPGAVWEQFIRLYNDGPETGVFVAAALSRLGGIPSSVSNTTPNKWLLRLADVYDYSAAGVPKSMLPTFVPGRAIRAEDHSIVQIATPGQPLAAAVAAVAAVVGPARPGAAPDPIAPLREVIPFEEFLGESSVLPDRWDLVIGQREEDLGRAVLSLYDGEHALVSGPARCGKSTILLNLARALKAAAPNAVVLGYGGRRSPLPGSPLLDVCAADASEVAQLADRALVATGPTLILLDDCEALDDPGGKLASLLGAGQPNLHVVIAGRSDVLRGLYGHWTQTVRRSRAGLLIQPALDRDGELLSAKLPYRLAIDLPPGRGFLVCGGDQHLVQVGR